MNFFPVACFAFIVFPPVVGAKALNSHPGGGGILQQEACGGEAPMNLSGGMGSRQRAAGFRGNGESFHRPQLAR